MNNVAELKQELLVFLDEVKDFFATNKFNAIGKYLGMCRDLIITVTSLSFEIHDKQNILNYLKIIENGLDKISKYNNQWTNDLESEVDVEGETSEEYSCLHDLYFPDQEMIRDFKFLTKIDESLIIVSQMIVFIKITLSEI